MKTRLRSGSLADGQEGGARGGQRVVEREGERLCIRDHLPGMPRPLGPGLQSHHSRSPDPSVKSQPRLGGGHVNTRTGSRQSEMGLMGFPVANRDCQVHM